MIKERGPSTGRGEGGLGMERIKSIRLGSKDQDFKED
jgi:hypothetical protein